MTHLLDTEPPAPDALLFSIKCYLAAALALYIALSLHLPRAPWAVLTTYITAQPYSAAVRSRAVFRLLGALLGLVAAVVLVPALVDYPQLLCTALAAWIGLSLYVSLLERTPRFYTFRLAGFTAGLIGFPSVANPETVFPTALERTEEIALGVICAALVHGLVFPQPIEPVVRWRIRQLVRSVRNSIATGLNQTPGPADGTERSELSAAMTDLHLLATHLDYRATDRNLTPRNVQPLEDRLGLLLPTLAAAEDRLAAIAEVSPAAAAKWATLVREVAAWACDEGPESSGRGRGLLEQIRAQERALSSCASQWVQLLELSLLARLRELIELLMQTRAWSQQLIEGWPRVSPQAARPSRPLHIDHRQAAIAGFAAAVAVIVCCVFWIEAAWPGGAVAAMIAGVFASLFANMDDPTPAIRQMYRFVLLSVPLAAIYEFAVLPVTDGFVQLCVALAPVLGCIGFLLARPEYSSRAMPLLVGLVPSLSLTGRYNDDFTGFINSNLAQLVGSVAAVSCVGLISAMGVQEAIARLMRLTRRDLADLASGRRPASRSEWRSRMLDRIGLLLPRLPAADESASIEPWLPPIGRSPQARPR